MTIWEESWVRIDHDGLDDPPDLADVSTWALLAVGLMLLPICVLWVLSEEACKAVRRACH